jgi:predicted ATPase
MPPVADNAIRLTDLVRGADLRDTPAVAHRLEAFVGREAELAVVTTALDDGARGRGGTVIVRGQSGIGKSRLAEEAASLATARGYTVVWGRSWEAGGAPSFWPWVQAIRSLCRDLDPARLSDSIRKRLARLLPELDESASAPDLGSGDVADPARFRRLDAFTSALCELAVHDPILVVLDDLHAADFCTLALLDFVARPLHSANVVVIGTLRDREAQQSPHAALLGRITQDARAIALGPLDPSAVRDYLSQTTGEADLAELADTLHGRTDGHPLFMVELLRLLAGSPASSADVVWQRNLPRGLEQTLRMRTSELAAKDREVVEMAAIMGREVSLTRLATAFDVALDRARAAAEAAVALGILLTLTPEHYRFSHILVRDVLERDLPDERRWSLHQRLAEALTEGRTAPWSEIAHHLESAGPQCRGQAIDALWRAGEAACARLAFEDADRGYRRGLALNAERPDPDDRMHAELLIGRCRTAMRGGDPDEGWRCGNEAAALARTLGDAELLARTTIELGSVLVFGKVDDRLVSLLREALDALPAGDSSLRALLQGRLAAALQPAEDPARPIALARDAIEMARRVGDSTALLSTLRYGCSAMVDLAPAEERVELNREHARLATEAGAVLDALRAETRLIFDCFELADRLAADHHVRAATSLIEQFDHASVRWRVPAMEAMRAAWDGAIEAALEANARAAALGAESGDPNARSAAVWQRQRILRLLGRRAQMAAGVGAMRDIFHSTPTMRDYLQVVISAQLLQVGQRDAALGIVDAPLMRRVTRMGDRSVLEALAELAFATGDRLLAAQLQERALPHADCFLTGGVIGLSWDGPMHRLLALCAQTLGEPERAVEHFERGILATRRMGGDPVATWMSAELGGVLLQLGRKDRAREVLTAARKDASSMAMASVFERAERALARLHDPEPTAEVVVPTPAPAEPQRLALAREGDVWLVRFEGDEVRVRDSKGMGFLAALIAEPGRDLHALDLATPAADRPQDAVADEMIDDTARKAYRARLVELRSELDEAEEWNDSARAHRLQEELDALAAELARGVGLGGRPRRFGTSAERARVNVQRRIRDAIRRLGDKHEALGRHLERSVRTGMYCRYDPE